MKTIRSHNGNLEAFLKRYRYQPELTTALDSFMGQFNQSLINEITLWKVNRYAKLGAETLSRLNNLVSLEAPNHRGGEECLRELLGEAGVDLPIASTYMRFRNPDVFQIVDRHAYRAVYGEKYPLYRSTSPDRKVELYFKYLDELRAFAQSSGIPFRGIDRILYVFDKELNAKLD